MMARSALGTRVLKDCMESPGDTAWETNMELEERHFKETAIDKVM